MPTKAGCHFSAQRLVLSFTVLSQILLSVCSCQVLIQQVWATDQGCLTMADLFGLANTYADDSTSQFSGSSGSGTSSSIDSALERHLAAQARLKDYGHHKEAAPGVLPSAFNAFDEVEGPPEFLDPEATRPLAQAEHGRLMEGTPAGSQQASAGNKKLPPGQDFDISRLAPPLAGQKRDGEEKGPPGAVIEGKAKRYKQDEGVEATQQYSAVQIAMLGGNVQSKADVQGPTQPPGAAGPAKVASKPMEVSEFLNKGEGAALLPRKAQDRKDKEKAKRTKGQSSVHGWKTEAEMVLRQQFDS